MHMGQCVSFMVLVTRSVGYSEVKTDEKEGPAGLSSIQALQSLVRFSSSIQHSRFLWSVITSNL